MKVTYTGPHARASVESEYLETPIVVDQGAEIDVPDWIVDGQAGEPGTYVDADGETHEFTHADVLPGGQFEHGWPDGASVVQQPIGETLGIVNGEDDSPWVKSSDTPSAPAPDPVPDVPADSEGGES